MTCPTAGREPFSAMCTGCPSASAQYISFPLSIKARALFIICNPQEKAEPLFKSAHPFVKPVFLAAMLIVLDTIGKHLDCHRIQTDWWPETRIPGLKRQWTMVTS